MLNKILATCMLFVITWIWASPTLTVVIALVVRLFSKKIAHKIYKSLSWIVVLPVLTALIIGVLAKTFLELILPNWQAILFVVTSGSIIALIGFPFVKIIDKLLG